MNLKVNGKPPEADSDYIEFKVNPIVLISDITRLMNERLHKNSEEHPVGQKSGRMLLVELSKKDGRTQLDLANATHLKAPTISVSLQKLEKDGFVTRKPDEYDLRATRVFLTEKGRELDAKIRKRMHIEEKKALTNLSSSEYETLMRLLTKIKNNLVDDSEKDGMLY